MSAFVRTIALLVSTTLLMAATMIVTSAGEAEGVPTRSRSAVAMPLVELQSTLAVRHIKVQRQGSSAESEILTLNELEVKRTRLVDMLENRATEPAVLADLIAVADGNDLAIAGLSRVVIDSIEPTPDTQRREIAGFVSHAVENVRSHDLRIVLVNLLGKFRDAYSLSVLQKTFMIHHDTKLRLAAILALKNFGALAGEFLLGELNNEANDRSIRLACLDALEASSYRPAVPVLIDLLENTSFSNDARLALREITNSDLGERSAAWQQWWSNQPSPAQRR
jgi:hypothetical protein